MSHTPSIYTITGLGGSGVARAIWENDGTGEKLRLKGAPRYMSPGTYSIEIHSTSGSVYTGDIKLAEAPVPPPSYRPPTPIPVQHRMKRNDESPYALAFSTFMGSDGRHRVSTHLQHYMI